MKKICIIGASSGIGLALAKYYISTGNTVDTINRDDFDLSVYKDIRNLSHKLSTKKYDIVIFSAGQGYYRDFFSLTSAEISSQILINSLAPLQVVREISVETKFVYLSSIMRYIPAKNMSVYAAMKSASSQTLLTLISEEKNKNILSINLGAVKTDMHIKAGMQKNVGKDIDVVIPKLVKAIDTKFGNVTLFFDWKCMVYIVFPLYRLVLGIKSIGSKF